MERLGPPFIDVSVTKNSLLVYVLNVYGILAGRCGSVVVSRGDIRIRQVRVRHCVAVFFRFHRNTLNNRSKIFQMT